MATKAPTAAEVSEMVRVAIRSYDAKRPRSIQSREGRLGPSDLGFCRAKAALMVRGIAPTDSKSLWPAHVGTAVGEWVEKAIKDTFPHWIVGSVDEVDVTYTMTNGSEVTGRPDIIATDLNAVLDLKTKDGLEVVRRYDDSLNYKFQRHAYLRGAVAAGLLDPTKPLYVGNVYLDRSGKDEQPYVTLEPVDDSLDDQIAGWVDDVIYARLHDEEAERDVASEVCERICEFFTVCRGNLPSQESEVIRDPEVSAALVLYVEATEAEKKAKRDKEAAKSVLDGINGTDGTYQVRWTYINESTVPSFTRAASQRISVTKLRGAR